MVNFESIHKASILIVDDDPENLALLAQILRSAGYTSVEATSNPGEAYEMHKARRFALILLDLQMPEMDGFDLMEKLKPIDVEAGSYLPVLALTAHSSHKLRALESGAKDFISKPFDPPEFLTRVYNLLEVRLLHEETLEHGKMLEALALHDALTGLANRRLLLERMAMALAQARRSKAGMAVMYLDLDGFKQINDTLGHKAGDLLLTSVAKRLTAAVREEDTVARLGGDEFIVSLPHVANPADATRMAQKIVDTISRPYDLDGTSASITVSIGIGIFPENGRDAETLMRAADAALYEAKRAGKNNYQLARAA
ncbi:MAG: diguanylate cyclase [Betaproteobacteria bacterium]